MPNLLIVLYRLHHNIVKTLNHKMKSLTDRHAKPSLDINLFYLARVFEQLKTKAHAKLSCAASDETALHYGRINVASSCFFSFSLIN